MNLSADQTAWPEDGRTGSPVLVLSVKFVCYGRGPYIGCDELLEAGTSNSTWKRSHQTASEKSLCRIPFAHGFQESRFE